MFGAIEMNNETLTVPISQELKLVKLKNVEHSKEIIKWLTTLLKESESLYSPLTEEINHPNENFFVIKDNGVIMPAYILCDRYEALVLWVHESCRKKGYARFMIRAKDIRYAIAAPDSVPFWLKIGFKRVDNSFSTAPIRVRRKKAQSK